MNKTAPLAEPFSKAREHLEQFCKCLRTLWETEGFQPVWSSFHKEVRVCTSAADGAPHLPRTHWPIRGAPGVEVRVGEYDLKLKDAGTEDLIRATIDFEWQRERDPFREVKERLNSVIMTMFDALDEVPGLSERIFEAVGYKHYEPEELPQVVHLQPVERQVMGRTWVLMDALSDELNGLGFTPEKPESFQRWDDAIDGTLDRLAQLAAREENLYDVMAFLNGPLVDSDEEVSLGEITVSGTLVEVFLGPAPDELLTRLVRGDYHLSKLPLPNLSPVNSVLRYQIGVRVDAPVDTYLSVYADGAEILGRAMDVLRLLREEDIGIVTLHVFGARWATPDIRTSHERTYQPEFAARNPRRSFYYGHTAEPLTEPEFATLRAVAPVYLNGEVKIKGFPVAMRRFRDSRERYHPDDPEALLDVAIAFEAIFLNDTDNTQELSYRLSIRAARLLGATLQERLDVQESIRDLYTVRSKLAHGAVLSSMKRKDRIRLERTVIEAPRILRAALLRMLEGSGPTGLTGENLTKWWKRLELA